MKNLIFSLILGLILVSCGDGVINNPPEPPAIVKYTVEAKNDSAIGGTITPSSVTVNSGSDVTLTITPDFGFTVKELKVNGTVVSLTSTTTYTIKNVTSDTKAVIIFKKGLNWYLTQKSWIIDSMVFYSKNGTVTTYDNRQARSVYTFLPNGKLNGSLGGSVGGSMGTWILDETKKPNTLIDGYNNEIQRLDENAMILNNLTHLNITHDFIKGDTIVKVIEFYSHNIPK